jgi:hypothetical protein
MMWLLQASNEKRSFRIERNLEVTGQFFLRYNCSIFLTGLMKSKNHLARIQIGANPNISDNHHTPAFSIIILTGAYT